MGHRYDAVGRLVCDSCSEGKPGTKYRKCPFGYCYGPDLCPECYRKHRAWFKKSNHKKCEQRAAEIKANDEKRRRLIREGAAVRCSAVQEDSGKVRVWFSCIRGDLQALMAPEVYRAVPLLEVATLDDYRRHGAVEVVS